MCAFGDRIILQHLRLFRQLLRLTFVNTECLLKQLENILPRVLIIKVQLDRTLAVLGMLLYHRQEASFMMFGVSVDVLPGPALAENRW